MNHYRIMRLYFQAAEAARDPEFYAQCKQRKSYLTREVIERWGIGKAPTLGQCQAVGLSPEDLQAVGLYVKRDYGPVMFFRDAMVFPFVVGGEIVYATSRRLHDHNPKTGEKLTKGSKALSMRTPDRNGFGGLYLNDGLNVEALKGKKPVLLVEGPADAIACTERGHPAIAMVGKSPRPGLIKAIREAKVGVYLALDGTDDVTPEERIRKAAAVGPSCWICELPKGKDPDDLTAEELTAIKAQAIECLEAWIKVHRDDRGRSSDEFAGYLRHWIKSDPDQADVLRESVCSGLGLHAEEWNQLIAANKEEAWDNELRDKVRRIVVLEGSKRDAETMALLEWIAPELGRGTALMRDRVKGLVCEALKLGKKAFDHGLKEARAKVKDDGVDAEANCYAEIARGWLGALRRGEWKPS